MRMRLAYAASMDPDQAFVERTLRGDLTAFEALVERHRGVVFRVAARVVDDVEAEDVAQDAFLRAFHALPRFRGESPFRSWLLQITHNAALNALSRKRPMPLVDPAEGVAERANSEALERTPAGRLERQERVERLESKLRLLRPAHRTVLVLRDVEGLTYGEIATVTQSPVGSVKGRLARARRELIDLLRENTYDWELPR